MNEISSTTTAKTIGELSPGDVFRFDSLGIDVSVVSVEPTGTVKFGQVGPDATPMMRVTVTGMPKPFAGKFETSADVSVAVRVR